MAFTMSREQYQTVKENSDLLKVNQVTVRRWRIGSRDLDAFLESHATQSFGAANGDDFTNPDLSEAQAMKERQT
jgi:hypothetical protein